MWAERSPLRHCGSRSLGSRVRAMVAALLVLPRTQKLFVMRGRLALSQPHLLYFFEPRNKAARSLTASSKSGAFAGSPLLA